MTEYTPTLSMDEFLELIHPTGWATTSVIEFKLYCTANFSELERLIRVYDSEKSVYPVVSVKLVEIPGWDFFELRANLAWREQGHVHSAAGVDFGELQLVSGVLIGTRTTNTPWAIEHFALLKQYLMSCGFGKLRPEMPPTGSDVPTWLDYYHAMQQEHYKYSFADLARDSTYDAGYLRHENQKYMKSKGIS